VCYDLDGILRIMEQLEILTAQRPMQASVVQSSATLQGSTLGRPSLLLSSVVLYRAGQHVCHCCAEQYRGRRLASMNRQSCATILTESCAS
jgi:hypothetical protein